MSRIRNYLLLFSATALLGGCAADDQRVRMGIQDPIERHPPRSWHFPFPKFGKPKPGSG